MASDDKPVPLPEPNPSAPAVDYLGRYEIHGKPIDVYDVSPSADDPGGRTYIDPSEPNAMIIYGGGDPPLDKPLPIPTDGGGSGGDGPDGSGDPAGPGGAGPGEAPLKDTDSTFTNAPVGQTEQPCPWAALGKALDVGVGILEGVAAAAIGTLAAGFIAGIVGPTLAPFVLGGLAVVGVVMLAKEIVTLAKNNDPKISPSERRQRIGRVIGGFLFPATGQAGRFFGAGQQAGAGVRKALQGAVSKLIKPPIPTTGQSSTPPVDETTPPTSDPEPTTNQPDPSEPSPGQARANLGKVREQKVADLTGGKVSNEKITSQKMGSTDVDVEGPNGELIAVGGPKKASNLGNTVRSLRVMKENADARGVPAQAYFTKDTPQNVIDKAKDVLGPDNVFTFDDPPR